MRYDVTDHPLLDATANGLDPDKLAEHNELAEALLGLDTETVVYTVDDPLTADLNPKVVRAVVLQVNYQVASGTLAEVQEQDGVADLRATYRTIAGRFPSVSQQAQELVDQVRATYAERTPAEEDDGGWLVLNSRRR